MTPAATDPRVARSKDAVIDAAIDLLAEAGIGGTSIEAIAARAGVAKTTIYRHWPDRSSLLADAVRGLKDAGEIPDTGDLRADLIEAMTRVSTGLHTSRYGHALPSMLAAAEHDPELAEALHRIVAERRDALARRLRVHAAGHDAGGAGRHAGGDAGSTADAERLQAALVGPIFYRRLVVHRPFRPSEIERLVDVALAHLR